MSPSLSGWLIIAALANLACYLIFGIPIIYCMGFWSFQPVQTWVSTARILLALLSCLSLGVWGWQAARPFLGVWAAFELIPVIASAVLGFGSTCGGHPTLHQQAPQAQMSLRERGLNPHGWYDR
jgi:hypothetical protein